jgi:hypothetical protein
MTRQRAPATVVLVGLALVGLPDPATAQGAAGARAPIAAEPEGYALRHETDQIVLLAREDEPNASRLPETATQLGEYATGVRELLGSGRAPDVQLVVILDGPGPQGDGPPRIPHVDRPGRIFLYWYREGASDYLVSAAHEMVHAYRRAARTGYAGFSEEGLAQAIALRASPEGGGFPRYGTSLPVAAGHLVAAGTDIPIRDLWRDDRNVRRRCMIQAYLQRESFFAFLAQRFGLGSIIELVYDLNPNEEASWVEAFGTSFDGLAAAWREDLLAAWDATPDRETLAHRYRSESPARFQPFCDG